MGKKNILINVYYKTLLYGILLLFTILEGILLSVHVDTCRVYIWTKHKPVCTRRPAEGLNTMAIAY